MIAQRFPHRTRQHFIRVRHWSLWARGLVGLIENRVISSGAQKNLRCLAAHQLTQSWDEIRLGARQASVTSSSNQGKRALPCPQFKSAKATNATYAATMPASPRSVTGALFDWEEVTLVIPAKSRQIPVEWLNEAPQANGFLQDASMIYAIHRWPLASLSGLVDS